ncbi:MAG: phosphatase PAP2 family protein [Rhodospirillales bacterium]
MIVSYLRWSVVVFAITAASVAWLDEPIARYFHDSWGGTPLFAVFHTITDLGRATAYIVIALAVILICRAGERMGRLRSIALRIRPCERAALCVLGSLAASGLVVNVLKPVFGRTRPRELFAGGDFGFSPFAFDFHHLNSFPSGHAQTIWAVFAVLMILHPRWRWWFAGVAVAVSASRVLIAAHFLGDVIAGAWFGFLGAVLACAIAESRGRIAGGPHDAGQAPVAR